MNTKYALRPNSTDQHPTKKPWVPIAGYSQRGEKAFCGPWFSPELNFAAGYAAVAGIDALSRSNALALAGE
jgi:hypothetical protein